MTQSSRKDSTGRKNLKEGPHGGAQDEGPCRDQLDDDGELLRSTHCKVDDRKLAKIVGAMTRAYLKSEDFIFAMQQRSAYGAETQCRGMQSKVGVEAPLAGIDQATVDIADIGKAAVDNEDNFAVAAEDNFADAGYNLQAKSAESTPELRAEALVVITVAGGNLATAVPADAPDEELADLAK